MPRSTKKKKTPDAASFGNRVVAQNRRARHDYEILESFEAGIELVGGEVKSLRAGRVQLRDSYARIEGGEVLLLKMNIASYAQATGFGAFSPERTRRLLLHRFEIDRLTGKLEQDRLALIPLSVYFKNGLAKVELALARGRTTYDKRHVLQERDAAMEMKRLHATYR
ncbi:MAG: SsrA-binding protein SmpB [Ferrimicrobium sp.]|uniref:SsrA-binding protein SmpB n=1 Tax=Ferrimicrobium sp. TaxID=2926050 RepID=UPI00260E7DF4|nr:SsrA-binding protein SmpB [Ferrimicrobium sp.]